MNYALLLTTIGLLFALVAMERLAARALQADSARWRAHYAAIPATAIITAELRWQEGTWITAYVDENPNRPDSLHVVALQPLSPGEYATCLRWLRAEGFADRIACGAPPQREQHREFGT